MNVAVDETFARATRIQLDDTSWVEHVQGWLAWTRHSAAGAPRLFVIEAEYALAMLRAEQDWVLALAEDITSGRLAWPR